MPTLSLDPPTLNHPTALSLVSPPSLPYPLDSQRVLMAYLAWNSLKVVKSFVEMTSYVDSGTSHRLQQVWSGGSQGQGQGATFSSSCSRCP